MAGLPLPTNILPGDTGHADLHNDVNGVVNQLAEGSTPFTTLTVTGDANTNPIIVFTNNDSSGAPGNMFRMQSSRALTALQTNDLLASIIANGYGTTGFGTDVVGTFTFRAAENFTDTAKGTYFVLITTPIGSVNNAERLRILDSGFVGIGDTAPTVLLQVRSNTSTTNAVVNMLRLEADTTGTAAAGLGVGFTLSAEATGATEDQDQVRLRSAWDVATVGSRRARGTLSAFDASGERDALIWAASGSAAQIGFLGATPVSRQNTTGTATGFTAGAGTNVTDQSTFTGGSGSTAYRISDIVLALKNYGLLAA